MADGSCSPFALRNHMMERTSHLAGLWIGAAIQTRLTQTKPVLPLSNEHSSQVKDQGRRQSCHNKHKKFPYHLTSDVSLLSGHASYCGRIFMCDSDSHFVNLSVIPNHIYSYYILW
jgi:hypothetical protein